MSKSCLLACLMAIIIPCNAQTKTEDLGKSKEDVYTIKVDPNDVDPYFTESTTIKSEFGPNSFTRNIIQDSKGIYWLASWKGIMSFDPNLAIDGTSKPWTNYTNKEGLRRYHMFAVKEDSKKHLWFGSIGAGIYYYDGQHFVNYSNNEGLAGNQIGCFYEDTKGNLWIGTSKGISVCNLNEPEITFRNYIIEGDENNSDVNSIIEDKNGTMWIGTRGKAFTYDGKNFKPITDLTGQTFTNVRSIIQDKNGNYWLGGNDGLNYFNGTSFTNLTKNFTGDIYQDTKGRIWTGSVPLGSSNWNLKKYDSNPLPFSEKKVNQIGEQQGQIFGIMEDDKGNIWYGQEKGVTKYNGEFFVKY